MRIILGLATAATVLAAALPAQAAPSVLLPAYAHNDYGNRHPLRDALDAGYRGAEADVYLVNGRLLVAHDREDVRADRTLEALYLDPLRALAAQGPILVDGSAFQLNIETKQPGREAYDALVAVLARYADILTVVRDGRVSPGPVRVVLVGWTPSLDEMAAEPVRYAAVHRHARDLPPDHARDPADLLAMVSVKYRQEFRWSGHGRPPAAFTEHLAELVATAHAVPGRTLRVFNVPRTEACYRALVAGGVDLVGTRTLGRSRKLLLRAGAGTPVPKE